MSKSIVIIVLIVLAFSLGVIADENLKSDGWSWQKINYIRQLGFVEGFAEGENNTAEILAWKNLCNYEREHDPVLSSICILSRLRGGTYTDTDAGKTIENVNRLYASPQNLPIHWGHAVIISRAMVSSVPVSEKDLEVIRQVDATPPKRMSEKELEDLLNNKPPKRQ